MVPEYSPLICTEQGGLRAPPERQLLSTGFRSHPASLVICCDLTGCAGVRRSGMLRPDQRTPRPVAPPLHVTNRPSPETREGFNVLRSPLPQIQLGSSIEYALFPSQSALTVCLKGAIFNHVKRRLAAKLLLTNDQARRNRGQQLPEGVAATAHR